jgi:hypothetical protein
MTNCRNCDTPLDGNFCPACGQKNVDLERPMSKLVGEVLTETFELDGRTYRTVRTLVRHPGALTAEFLAGRRKSYTPPLRLYLVISVSFFVLVTWLAGQGVLLDPGQIPEQDAATQAQFMSDDLPRLMFMLLPVYALLLKAAFPRRFYFDHIIFSLHLHSAAYVILAVMLPIEKVASDHWLPLVAQALLCTYFLVYNILSMRRVYHTGWFIGIAKSLAILLGYFMVISVAIEAGSNFLILSD